MRTPFLPAPRKPHDFFAAWTAENAASPVRAADDDRPRSKRAAVRWGVLGLTVAGIGTAVIVPVATANADPSPSTWLALRTCESSNNYSTNTGNDHYGAYQFDIATWRSVGGSGLPSSASKAEQDARALILYRRRGWQPWQCAGILGLREDSDAGTGRTSDISVASGGSSGSGSSGSGSSSSDSSGIPDFPGGSHWYVLGESSPAIRTFQNQMHSRGYFPAGTGNYDPATLSMIKQLQRLNGLIPNGYLGPNTWRLAWTGVYRKPAAKKTSQTSTKTSTSPRTPSATTAPAFPGGSHWYVFGETSRNIKTFQDQMHRRGYFPVGTGQYGPNTLRMVEQLQRLNGLVPNGLLGPNTWRLAWTGTYHD